MENRGTIEGKIASLLKSKKFAVLSTINDGQPYASLVAFVGDTDLKIIFFATQRSTQKFKNIKANKRIALLVENTTNTETDINDAMALTIMGKAEIAKTDEKGRRLSRPLRI